MIDEQVTPPEWYLTVRLIRTDRGGARQQSDYYGPGSSFKMYAGRRLAGLKFEALADDVVDPGESVELSFDTTNLPEGVVVGEPATTVIHILDGPSGPTAMLDLSPDTISENRGVSTVTARLNRAASEDVTLNVAAVPGAGTEASDFTLSSNTTLTIAKGQTSSTGTVRITAANDAIHGSDKTVSVTASVTAGPSNLRSPSGQTLTITDDDTTPTVTLALGPTSISEDGGSSTVTATLSGATSENVTLTVSATPVSPATASDFELSANKVLTITAGQTSSTGTVTITAEDNDVDAVAKEVTVSATVTSGPTGLAAPASQTLTITDDEGAPTVTLVLDPASIPEDGGSSTVTATLSGPSSENVTVTVTAAPVAPAEATDFTLAGATLTIAAGHTESSGTVTVTAEDNNIDASDKRVTVRATVTGGNGAAAPAALTLTIRDDEATPTVTLALDRTSISENRGVSTVTASLNGLSSADVVVTVSATAVDPAVASDFTLSGNRKLTITAGQTESTGTVMVTAVNNDVDAPNKTVQVTASVTGGNGLAPPASRTLTITDDEALPEVTLALELASIGENGGISTVTASLDRPTSERVTVTVSAAPVGPATTSDFQQTGTTLTIEPGGTVSTGTVTIAAVNNTVDAPDKSVDVTATVAGGNGVAAPAKQTLTIRDDEALPVVTLALDRVSIGEDDGESTVTATLSGTSSETVTVTVSATAVVPAAATDFTLTGTTLTIAAGRTESTGTVTVTAANNTMDSPNKTVEVMGTVTGGNGVTAPAARTLTIVDDEGAPTVTLSLDPVSISENGEASTVTATLSGSSSAPVTVTVEETPVAPATAADFTLTGTTLTIDTGQTSSTGTVTITAVNNTVDARDKTVTVSATVSGGNGVSAPAPKTLTITDDDGTPQVTLALDPTSIGEDGEVTTVTASLSAPSSEAVKVMVAATADSPAISGDFELSTNTDLTIAPGQTESTGTVTITAVDNTQDAPNKTVTVTASVTGGNGVSAPPAQSLTITDDDGTPTVTLKLDPASIGENGGVSTVTASLTAPSSDQVTVTVSATPTAPALETDFTLTGSTLTIDPGETESTGTVTIAAVNNDVDAPDKTVEVTGSVTGGRGVTAPAAQTLTIEDDEPMPIVNLDLTPPVIEEDGGQSEVRAFLSGPSSEPVKVNVDASPGSEQSLRRGRSGLRGAAFTTPTPGVSAIGNGFDLSANRELTIGGGRDR